jgi:hypothetical protein
VILPFASLHHGHSSFKNQRILSVPLGLTFQNSVRSAHTVILRAKYGWIFIVLVNEHPLLQIALYRHVHRIQPYRLLGPPGGQAILHKHAAPFSIPVYSLNITD